MDILTKITTSDSLSDIFNILEAPTLDDQITLARTKPTTIANSVYKRLQTKPINALKNEKSILSEKLKTSKKYSSDVIQTTSSRFNSLNDTYGQMVQKAINSSNQFNDNLTMTILLGLMWIGLAAAISVSAILFTKAVFSFAALSIIPALAVAATFLANPLHLIGVSLAATFIFAIPLVIFAIKTCSNLATIHQAEKEVTRLDKERAQAKQNLTNMLYTNWITDFILAIFQSYPASNTPSLTHSASYNPVLRPRRRTPFTEEEIVLNARLDDALSQVSNTPWR